MKYANHVVVGMPVRTSNDAFSSSAKKHDSARPRARAARHARRSDWRQSEPLATKGSVAVSAASVFIRLPLCLASPFFRARERASARISANAFTPTVPRRAHVSAIAARQRLSGNESALSASPASRNASASQNGSAGNTAARTRSAEPLSRSAATSRANRLLSIDAECVSTSFSSRRKPSDSDPNPAALPRAPRTSPRISASTRSAVPRPPAFGVRASVPRSADPPDSETALRTASSARKNTAVVHANAASDWRRAKRNETRRITHTGAVCSNHLAAARASMPNALAPLAEAEKESSSPPPASVSFEAEGAPPLRAEPDRFPNAPEPNEKTSSLTRAGGPAPARSSETDDVSRLAASIESSSASTPLEAVSPLARRSL